MACGIGRADRELAHQLRTQYIADCKALAEIAEVIGRTGEANELRSRAEQFSKAIETLWDEPFGLYLNRRTDTGELSKRISPTNFYPLIGQVPQPERAQAMVNDHFLNPSEFAGEYMIPSISRNDPAFPEQGYWKGAVWPPLNFLVYLGLRNYDVPEARRELVTKSRQIFAGEWKRKGFFSENYSGITGAGDDPGLVSTQDYSWGVLMGLLSFVENGELSAPEATIVTNSSSQ